MSNLKTDEDDDFITSASPETEPDEADFAFDAKEKKKKRSSIISRIILIICACVFVFAAVRLVSILLEYKKGNDIYDNIEGNVLDDTPVNITIGEDNQDVTIPFVYNHQALLDINPDGLGFLYVPSVDIRLPIAQTTDNDFYLTHSFDKSYNKAGWIFADYINKNLKNNELDKNTIIYGHNRQNNSMFGTLSNVFKEEWLSNKENHYINFSTLNNNMVWEVFSTYTIEKEEYYIQSNFSSDEEYISFLNTIKNRSTYKYDVNISKEDKILTLSTCTNVGKGRTVLHAKLIYRK